MENVSSDLEESEPASQFENKTKGSAVRERRFWTISVGEGAEHWDEFHEERIAAIGWDELGDLRKYQDKEQIRLKLCEQPGTTTRRTNDALACWEFANKMHRGDVVLAKQGYSNLLGCGLVTSEYEFDAERPQYKHIHDGGWLVPEDSKMGYKTLTDVTRFGGFLETVGQLVGVDWEDLPEVEDDSARPKLAGPQYWWLNANPKTWVFDDISIGQCQTYTSHNSKGNKRQKYKWFEQVKIGDIVVGYVTSPAKEVTAVCRITKPLHLTADGDKIEFEKTESLERPIPFATLQAAPELAEAEPIVKNQGSLFRLSESEYEAIRSIIDEANVDQKVDIPTYTKEIALQELFLAESEFDSMLDALREKKNVVLQGAPGVGKTFVARRLAYSRLGFKDPKRVEMIQFHQSYSYEDFIQGFRPTDKGHFQLKSGLLQTGLSG